MQFEHTIYWLIRGRDEVLMHYQRALEIWTEVEAQIGYDDVDTLSIEVSARQRQFEHECGGRFEGQEIMNVSGIAQFYRPEEGFGDSTERARNLVRAIARSGCSMEVKGNAIGIAELYDLFEPDEIQALSRQI